jgi:hypothetical protein
MATPLAAFLVLGGFLTGNLVTSPRHTQEAQVEPRRPSSTRSWCSWLGLAAAAGVHLAFTLAPAPCTGAGADLACGMDGTTPVAWLPSGWMAVTAGAAGLVLLGLRYRARHRRHSAQL